MVSTSATRPSEPTLQELLEADITALVMRSDKVQPAYVRELATRTATQLKDRECCPA